jgi:hypothetical protein
MVPAREPRNISQLLIASVVFVVITKSNRDAPFRFVQLGESAVDM